MTPRGRDLHVNSPMLKPGHDLRGHGSDHRLNRGYFVRWGKSVCEVSAKNRQATASSGFPIKAVFAILSTAFACSRDTVG